MLKIKKVRGRRKLRKNHPFRVFKISPSLKQQGLSDVMDVISRSIDYKRRIGSGLQKATYARPI